MKKSPAVVRSAAVGRVRCTQPTENGRSLSFTQFPIRQLLRACSLGKKLLMMKLFETKKRVEVYELFCEISSSGNKEC